MTKNMASRANPFKAFCCKNVTKMCSKKWFHYFTNTFFDIFFSEAVFLVVGDPSMNEL